MPFYWLISIIILSSVAGGALIGMLPFFLGRSMGRPGLGNLGMFCSIMGGLLFLSFFVAIGFTIAICVSERDYPWPGGYQSPPPGAWSGAGPGAAPRGNLALTLTCLSGPLRGQVYPIGGAGLLMGRDLSCAVRLPDGTPGVSGRHCRILWRQGVPVLEDLNSTYGTFLGDGSRLPPNYPVQLAAGSRFYLGNTECLFQVSMM